MTANPINGVPEDRVPRILARAAELDRIAPTVQLDTIRAAAMEAGISAAAIESALQEFAAGEVAPAPQPIVQQPQQSERWWKRALRKLKHPVALFGVSFVLGIFGDPIPPTVFLGWAMLFYVGGRTAWQATSVKGIGRFALVVLAIAWGLGLGYGAVEGDEDILASLAVSTIIFLAGGMLTIFARNFRRVPESQPV